MSMCTVCYYSNFVIFLLFFHHIQFGQTSTSLYSVYTLCGNHRHYIYKYQKYMCSIKYIECENKTHQTLYLVRQTKNFCRKNQLKDILIRFVCLFRIIFTLQLLIFFVFVMQFLYFSPVTSVCLTDIQNITINLLFFIVSSQAFHKITQFLRQPVPPLAKLLFFFQSDGADEDAYFFFVFMYI